MNKSELIEKANAILEEHAWDQNLGYKADCLHESNYRGILRDFPKTVEGAYLLHTSVLQVRKNVTVKQVSALLEALEESLGIEGVYDEDLYFQVESERIHEEARGELVDRGLEPTDEQVEKFVTALYEFNGSKPDCFFSWEMDGTLYISSELSDLAYEEAKNEQA